MSIKNFIRNRNVCITDYFNVYSDFREVKYKKLNIDFHKLKYANKEEDTIDFFNLFFTKYISYIKIDKTYQYIFVMKKIHNYENILKNILKIHNDFDITFIIIEQQYNNLLIDKNKDDFLCQYIFSILTKNKNNNCVLISNDRFRDRNTYTHLFVNNSIHITILNKLLKSTLSVEIDKNITSSFYKINSCGVSKHDLDKIC